ncbi:DNA repair protein RadA [Candidatus Dependentiae bacterium]|nr:DNA repair protein RadA [Candidatus Dependentiae bacterium]
MAKQKTIFFCTNCGQESARWIGCCTQCNEWNTYTEFKEAKNPKKSAPLNKVSSTVMHSLNEISTEQFPRFISGIDEWDRVSGGGILPGAFIILTGDPGVGKSTLLLQLGHALSTNDKTVFYFSSEESLQQVKNRATRIGIAHTAMQFSDQTHLETIIAIAKEQKPHIMIIDSIQSCIVESDEYSFPGTVGQLKTAAFELMRLAKENNIAIIITGHITKDGTMAGPKVLEHMVDAVFYLQGDDRFETRILRAVKNRFGTINEIGFFQMNADGMSQVSDINALVIQNASISPGASLICSMEGTRPVLVEVQALCIESKFGTPQRVISGLDHKRVVLVAAILEKYLRIKLSSQDIFFKVTGGFTVKETGSDLGIALALLSSYLQKALPPHTMALGEMSLTGHIKPISSSEKQLLEAHKFGIKNLITSHKTVAGKNKFETVTGLRSVYDLVAIFPE